MSGTLLRFPSYDILLERLEDHKHTSRKDNPYLYEKNIIASVAREFSHKHLYDGALDLKIQIILYDVDPGLHPAAVMTTIMNVRGALVDCGDVAVEE